MTDLDDRLRTAADLVHQQMDRLSIPEPSIAEPRAARPATRNRTRVVLAAAVIVVLIASVAAGIARRTNVGSGSRIATLGAATLSESARVRITVTLSPLGSKQSPPGTLLLQTGVFDFRHEVARLTFLTGPTSSSAPGSVELLIGERAYTSIDPKTAASFPSQLRDKRWSETDARNIANPFTSVNPFDPLAQLRQHHVTLRDLGMTRIGNQAVHHYAGTDHVRLTRPESVGQSETVTESFDVYVDNHNRLARLHNVLKEPGTAFSTIYVMDLSNYGARVNVTPPSASEVAAAADIPLHT